MSSLLPPDMATQGPCSHFDSLRNSITLWKEQEMLVDRMGPRVRAIHRSGNVSHFHEPWMEWAIVGRLSLSLLCVCLIPPPPFLFLLLPLFSHLDCVSPTVCSAELYLCGWEPSLARLCSNMYSYQRGEKNRKESPFVASFQRKSTANDSICKAFLLWCPQCNGMLSV